MALSNGCLFPGANVLGLRWKRLLSGDWSVRTSINCYIRLRILMRPERWGVCLVRFLLQQNFLFRETIQRFVARAYLGTRMLFRPWIQEWLSEIVDWVSKKNLQPLVRFFPQPRDGSPRTNLVSQTIIFGPFSLMQKNANSNMCKTAPLQFAHTSTQVWTLDLRLNRKRVRTCMLTDYQ